MNKTICFVAGKSGGHSIPCLTLARAAKQQDPQTRVVFITNATALDRQILSSQPDVDRAVYLKLGGLPGMRLWRYPTFVWQIACAFFKSIHILRRERPNQIMSTGGLVTVPVVLAARFLRIPVQLWELNVEPGKAIVFLSHLAQEMVICCAATQVYFKRPCVLRPYPVRFSESDKRCDRIAVLHSLGLHSDKFTIFILGGSQGSLTLNTALVRVLDRDPGLALQIQVIHQVGGNDQADWLAVYTKLGVPAHVFAYNHDLASLYQVSDFIISRAGAGAVAEITFFDKRAIMVPLATNTNDHQVRNAHEWARENHLLQVIDSRQLDFIDKLTHVVRMIVRFGK